jgi:hypothetical protein
MPSGRFRRRWPAASAQWLIGTALAARRRWCVARPAIARHMYRICRRRRAEGTALESLLITIFFQFEWNPAHDCVSPQNDFDFNVIALCDIAPPQKHIASQSMWSNLNASEIARIRM